MSAKITHPKAHVPAPLPKLTASQARESFDHLDRNGDGKVAIGELSAQHMKAPTGHLRGDKNADGALDRSEFSQLIKAHGVDPPRKPGHSRPGHALEGGPVVFQMPKGQSATFRTRASGLVLGRVDASDHFIASAQKGNWVYGHVQGHPDRKGWVLRTQLPPKASGHASLPSETPVDLKQHSAVKLAVNSGLGFTTPVRPKDATQPVKLYSNYPCTAANQRHEDGAPVSIPAGKDIRFRYTPDGKMPA